MKLGLILACAFVASAQNFTERGYIENSTLLYPQTAPNDSGQVVNQTLFRWDAAYKITPWLEISGSFDARFDSHEQTERTLHLDFDDRSLERPALSLRRLSVTMHKGKVTFEAGRQFIRWGETDFVNPTDRFAPKDYLNLADTDFLGVMAARLAYAATSNDTVELVWQPWFTPSRSPLLDQRWTALPAASQGVAITDLGAVYPGRSQYGARWSHRGQGYEYSLCYFDGFDNLPLFNVTVSPAAEAVAVQRYYPSLRFYGGDMAVPLPWLTVKGEAGYFSSDTKNADRYALYVIQLERQWKEWSFGGGYAGEGVTYSSGDPFLFSPDRGFAKSFVGHADWTIDANRTVSVETAVRSGGSLTRAQYSQLFGQHWRATAGYVWIRGSAPDFIGQYHLNSFALIALRYSF